MHTSKPLCPASQMTPLVWSHQLFQLHNVLIFGTICTVLMSTNSMFTSKVQVRLMVCQLGQNMVPMVTRGKLHMCIWMLQDPMWWAIVWILKKERELVLHLSGIVLSNVFLKSLLNMFHDLNLIVEKDNLSIRNYFHQERLIRMSIKKIQHRVYSVTVLSLLIKWEGEEYGKAT